MSVASPESAQRLLEAAYRDLDFEDGALVPTSFTPRRQSSPDEWRDIGDWLLLGARMGAERVFFVADDPVVVFSRLPSSAADAEIMTAYRRAWSLGRASCLFVALEGELRVYALTAPPPRSSRDYQSLSPLEVVTRAADVADRLAAYHRDNVESGALFEDSVFRRPEGRADQRLLRDVTQATDALVKEGLARPLAHALIERVILVRYLEDRGVIGPEYFQTVAGQNPRWQSMVSSGPTTPVYGAQSTLVNCMADLALTYAVFSALERDFNGDLFVVSPDETSNVSAGHLQLLQRLLTGAGVDGQEPLFLWAYDFSVVPTSLISSMYEQFYHAGTDDDSGTHYTPQELVEYTLAQTLTTNVLREDPRVLDPACGSGIFLVEAFRRIVRNEMAEHSRPITQERLLHLLTTRIAGIDINPEAVKLAAFSLYLAYLNYQNPPEIRAAGPLPRLLYRSDDDSSQRAVLVVADAFAPMLSESLYISVSATEQSPKRSNPVDILPWELGSFSVVVGNPPWDEPRGAELAVPDKWARRYGFPVGDRNRSQLFMWRALSFLRSGGRASLLVSATAFFNIRSSSRDFRSRWLEAVDLESVVNFTSARHVFFSGAVAPFLLITFRRPLADNGSGLAGAGQSPLVYRTVRPSRALAQTSSLAYANMERRWVDKEALRAHDFLWKTYAWGSHRDAALMARLDTEQQLRQILPLDPAPGWGYQRGSGPPSLLLSKLSSLRTFVPWGQFQDDWFEPPPWGVKRQPDERLYRGQRIIISRGVRAGFGPYARLVDSEFSFRHIIYCLPLPGMPLRQAKTVLGILLSSLGRYRLFMRSGSWGVWHDSITADDILTLPIRIKSHESPIIERIVAAVDALSSYSVGQGSLDGSVSGRMPAPTGILSLLDEAVFDLFELAPSERDLVNDFHTYTIGLTRGSASSTGTDVLKLSGVLHGTIRDISDVQADPLRDYLHRFLTEWNRELGPDGEFSWRIVGETKSALTAAVFETRGRNDELPEFDDMKAWQTILDRLSLPMMAPVMRSVAADGVLRSVTDTSIVVIKRNVARLWTATAAREDVEATMLRTIALRGD